MWDLLQSVDQTTLLIASIVVGALVYFAFFSSSQKNAPPRFKYLFRALFGHFNMKESGPVQLLWAGYKQQGDIFRLKVVHKNVTVLIGPAASTVMYAATDKEVSSRELYSFTIPVFGRNIVYDAPMNIMNQQLKFVKYGLGSKLMETYGFKIKEEAMAYFSDWPDEGEVDLHKKLSELTCITASRCLLGDEIREKVGTEFGPWYQELSDGLSHISIFFPHLPTTAHRKRDEARKNISKLFKQVIHQRRESGERKNDYLQLLMEAQYRDGNNCSDDDIVGIEIATLFGGQHTSAITSSWLGMIICKNKEKYLPRLMKEQVEVLDKYKGELSLSALNEMVLLNSSVKEMLRMFPPLIILGRTAQKDLKYKEFVIPKGEIIITVPSVSHRLPNVFKNPDEFEPERFLPPRVEDEKARYSFQAFGGGRHSCLGERFGFLQIKTIWSVLLRMFDFELKDPNWTPKVNYDNIVAGPCHGCVVKFKRKKDLLYM